MKLTKVYAVVARYKIKSPHRRYGILQLFLQPPRFYDKGPEFEETSNMTLAVFSTKARAENYISSGEDIPWLDELKNCYIAEWRVDYEIYWEEWHKLEDQERKQNE